MEYRAPHPMSAGAPYYPHPGANLGLARAVRSRLRDARDLRLVCGARDERERFGDECYEIYEMYHIKCKKKRHYTMWPVGYNFLLSLITF
ncbi:unnamed protein product [Colias eurytheme]|nr:unnamed protein product [Colias eurytheme]